MDKNQSLKTVKLLSPVSAANTAAATSGWTDVREADGDITVTLSVGALTGSITWTIEHATDGAGTGGAAITPDDGTFAAGAANATQSKNVRAQHLGGWMRCVGTIVTGPALVCATIEYTPRQF